MSGTSGTSRSSGSSGTLGSSGTSGIDGTSGSSGTSGTSGTSGSSGSSGTSGTSAGWAPGIDNRVARYDGANAIQQCSTITVDDSGRMVNTGQPCFNAYVNAVQSDKTGDGTIYNITGSFWTERLDQGNNFLDGTFTAPVTGTYQFNASIRISSITSSHTRMLVGIITSNKSYYLLEVNPYAIQGTMIRLSLSTLVDMDASDTVYLQVVVHNGTKVINIYNDYTEFSEH